jgi:hypothetical protein
MSTTVNTIVKLIEKHTGHIINAESIKSQDSSAMKSAIEAILQQIEVRAGSSESMRKMALQVRQVLQ